MIYPDASMEHKLIILVEDNPDDEFLTKRALKTAQVENQVVVCHDGVEALDYCFGRTPFEERAWPPQLILLDLKMPRLDGLEVLRQLRADARTRHLPIVILTSSAEDPDLRRAYELGANSYIVKPVDFDQFVDAVQRVGRYWLTLNEPAPTV